MSWKRENWDPLLEHVDAVASPVNVKMRSRRAQVQKVTTFVSWHRINWHWRSTNHCSVFEDQRRTQYVILTHCWAICIYCLIASYTECGKLTSFFIWIYPYKKEVSLPHPVYVCFLLPFFISLLEFFQFIMTFCISEVWQLNSRNGSVKAKICWPMHSRWPPLWSSGQSSWLQIQGYRVRLPGTTKKVVGLERGPLSLVSTTEELLDRKVAAPVYKTKNKAVGIRHADHVAPSIRKIWKSLRRQAAVARSV
jgi:hypothetical protein